MSRVPESRSRSGWAWMLALLVLGTAVAAWVRLGREATTGLDSDEATFAAKRGDLRIGVSDSGTIQAKDQVVIKSEVEGQTTIIYLVDEGTHVEPGDLLVELDASELVEDRTDRQIAVQNAEAAYVKAREDLAITMSQAESDIAEAELAHRFAIEDLKKYEEGEFPRLVTEAEAEITLALEELENATETLRWSEQLFEEKYISQTELDGDRLAKNRAELEHKLAVEALSLLNEYTYKRTKDELTAAVEQTDRALERVKRKAAANTVQAEAELRAKESEYNRQQLRLEKLDRQIENCRMVAPSAGMVVYATTGRGNWRRDDEPLEEGQSVRERQELIHLPTTGSMMAEVQIHESSLKKVKAGQRVDVQIDALPGRRFSGTVAKISPLPDGRSSWLNPDLKEYPAEIDLDGVLDGVRTGMSCRAEIIVAELEDVVYVPVQCVVRVGRTPTVHVLRPDGTFEAREVETGLDDNQMIHIASGLAEGERVSLTPPLQNSTLERGAPPAPDTPEDDADEGDDGGERATRGRPSDGEGRTRRPRRAEASGAAAEGSDRGRGRERDGGPRSTEAPASRPDAGGGPGS
ncbi:MAG: efflux RND transporter periplasmic adaptor subunit [Planctomycetota bacterium JB042]